MGAQFIAYWTFPWKSIMGTANPEGSRPQLHRLLPEVSPVVGDPLSRAVRRRCLQHNDLHLLANVALSGGEGALPFATG